MSMHLDPKTPNHTTALVFIGGYKGSLLRDANSGSVVWIDAREALFGRQALTLNHPALELRAGPPLSVDGPLLQVSVIPGLFAVDAYQRTLFKLAELSRGHADLHAFSYDWRQSNVRSAQELHQFIQRLRRTGYERILLVAHSMGGLVASYFLRYGSQPLDAAIESWEGAQLVDGIVFSGVPFRGALTIVRDMHEGIQQGLNTTLLSSEAVSSFPSSWELFPHPEDNPIINPDLSEGRNIIYDSEYWESHGWGLLQPEISGSEAARTARLRFVQEQMRDAERFQRLLNAPINRQATLRIPCLTLIGSGTPSLTRAILGDGVRQLAFTPREVRRYFPGVPSQTGLGDGDGTVATSAAKLPAAFQHAFDCETKVVGATHGQVTFASEGLERIKALLSVSTLGSPQRTFSGNQPTDITAIISGPSEPRI